MRLGRVSIVAAALSHVFSCASSPDRSEGWTVGGVSGGIGHFPCAVMLSLSLDVYDHQGDPVAAADVWELFPSDLNPPAPLQARKLGGTDAGGNFTTPLCLMDTQEFGRWHPETEPAEVYLMVFRDGVGARRITLRPDTLRVLEEGNTVGVTPEEWRSGHRATRDPERYKRRAHVADKVIL